MVEKESISVIKLPIKHRVDAVSQEVLQGSSANVRRYWGMVWFGVIINISGSCCSIDVNAATRSWSLVVLEITSYLLYGSSERIMEEEEGQCVPVGSEALAINIPIWYHY